MNQDDINRMTADELRGLRHQVANRMTAIEREIATQKTDLDRRVRAVQSRLNLVTDAQRGAFGTAAVRAANANERLRLLRDALPVAWEYANTRVANPNIGDLHDAMIDLKLCSLLNDGASTDHEWRAFELSTFIANEHFRR